jgi:hypothetical protein
MEQVQQLKEIFPTWQNETLAKVLISQDMSIDRAIEAIFAIESTRENAGEASANTNTFDASTNTQHSQGGTAAFIDDGYSLHPYFPCYILIRWHCFYCRSDDEAEEFYRGLPCKLPKDFLRVSIHRSKSFKT